MPFSLRTAARQRPARPVKMTSLPTIGRYLIVLGVCLVLVGGTLVLLGRLGLGRLPGDILIQRRGVVVWVPLVSSLVLSVMFTLVLNLLLRR